MSRLHQGASFVVLPSQQASTLIPEAAAAEPKNRALVLAIRKAGCAGCAGYTLARAAKKRAQITTREFRAASPAISHVYSAHTAAAVGVTFPSRLLLAARRTDRRGTLVALCSVYLACVSFGEINLDFTWFPAGFKGGLWSWKAYKKSSDCAEKIATRSRRQSKRKMSQKPVSGPAAPTTGFERSKGT